jgi:NAD(P)-dependent dehydrogenase (short-subunit alcohol dehydrogenase family)
LFPETALVTGGASGIGAAIVERLEDDGADVRVLDLREGFDVSDASAWESVGPVQLACLNAGVVTRNEDLRELSDAAYRRAVGT